MIPQCLGRFSPDNLILYKCVCDDCNQYFGDKLELFLGRDSFESIERKRHGIEPKKPLKNKRRVKSKIKDGEWKGVIVEDAKADKPGEIGIRNSIQAGFYNKFTDEYVYYEPNDIPTAEQLEKEVFDIHIACFIGNNLVGCLILSPIDDVTIKMRQVAVDENYQGKQIGKTIVKYSEEFAIRNGIKKITLHAREVVVLFYLKLGYKIIGEQFTEIGLPHYKIEKDL